MQACGVIAEYNPFHGGHAYQLSAARKNSGCDYVIAVMSGDFVQRGAPALLDKYTRAKAALACGADLVLMLPVYASTASAEGFARAGIAALLGTGVVGAVSFGCEDVSICAESYRLLARELSQESAPFKKALADGVASGMSYAAARTAAIKACSPGSFDPNLLGKPNNLLAFEYLRAIERSRSGLRVYPIKRRGSYHDACRAPETSAAPLCDADSLRDNAFLSAASCRRALLSDPESAPFALADARALPAQACRLLADYAADYAFLQEQDLSQMLHYALLSQARSGFSQYLDCGDDLSARIAKQLFAYEDFSQFCGLLKNKSLTHARIARTLTHILLQLPAKMQTPLVREDFSLPYLRVLGFREAAAPLLHEIKKRAAAPLITRPADAAALLSKNALAYFEQDLFASELYRSALLHKCGRCYAEDYRRRIEIV